MRKEEQTPARSSSAIFSPLRSGPLYFKNRLVALPVYTGYAYPDGSVSPLLREHYHQLSRSGVSMVVVANAAVSADGVTSAHTLRADGDVYLAGLEKLAKTIKRQGALACLQLNHAGRFAKTDQPLLPSVADGTHLAFNVASLKDFMNFFPLEKRFELTRFFLKQAHAWRRAMTAADIERIIDKFAEAAWRAYHSGFDIIELHGANGYLISQFLSAFTNRIASVFGGDFNKRMAFPLAVIREMKKRLPEDFPIGFRLMLREWVPGGIDLHEALAFARQLEKEGICYLSASVGSYNSIFTPDIRKKMSRPAFLRQEVSRLTSAVNIPTIISGRIIYPELANDIIRENVADLIGLGRPLRADIDWVKKAAGDEHKIMACMNCNWCLKRVILEQGFNCQRWARLIQQQTDFEHQLLSRNYKSLWVVADRNDMQLFKISLPMVLTRHLLRSSSTGPSILFLQTEDQDQGFDSDRNNFLKWSARRINRSGPTAGALKHFIKRPIGGIEKVISAEIRRNNFGMVLMGYKPAQVWRERLLYKERRKVIGLLNTSDDQTNIVVPVDLSPTTLLVLMFVRQSYMGQPAFNLNFVHVADSLQEPVVQRWHELKKILDFDEDARLQIFARKSDIATDLFNIITAGGYGTIIMGKRGFSGIKRWLLGSVSAGILHKLKDQSLFWVD